MKNLDNMEFEIFEAIPYNEESLPLSEPKSAFWQIVESQVLIRQIFRTIGNIPKDLNILSKTNDHDFGKYVTIEMYFNPENKEHLETLNKFQENFPDQWTKESREELKKLNHPLYI